MYVLFKHTPNSHNFFFPVLQIFITTSALTRILSLVLILMIIAHWDGCIQYLVPSLQNFPLDSWVTINGLQDKSIFSQYTWSLFKATSHILCIGYGPFPPQSDVDVWLTTISMVIGASFYAIFIGQISSLMHLDHARSPHRAYSDMVYKVNRAFNSLKWHGITIIQ